MVRRLWDGWAMAAHQPAHSIGREIHGGMFRRDRQYRDHGKAGASW
jgi:hypothetical protein